MVLASTSSFTVEQILSGRLDAPQDYVQDHDEWVVVLDGGAVLEVAGVAARAHDGGLVVPAHGYAAPPRAPRAGDDLVGGQIELHLSSGGQVPLQLDVLTEREHAGRDHVGADEGLDHYWAPQHPVRRDGTRRGARRVRRARDRWPRYAHGQRVASKSSREWKRMPKWKDRCGSAGAGGRGPTPRRGRHPRHLRRRSRAPAASVCSSAHCSGVTSDASHTLLEKSATSGSTSAVIHRAAAVEHTHAEQLEDPPRQSRARPVGTPSPRGSDDGPVSVMVVMDRRYRGPRGRRPLCRAEHERDSALAGRRGIANIVHLLGSLDAGSGSRRARKAQDMMVRSWQRHWPSAQYRSRMNEMSWPRSGHCKQRASSFAFGLSAMRWLDYVAFLEGAPCAKELPAPWVLYNLPAGRGGDPVVGRSSIRHTLTERLLLIGGHIGYAVLPNHRSRGYATEILRQSLVIAHSLGIAPVLVTCDEGDEPSARTIERCGGTLENVVDNPEGGPPKRRYWISVTHFRAW